MQTFLSAIDYNFYSEHTDPYALLTHDILTNSGCYSDEPNADIRENITHMITSAHYENLEKYKFNDYPNLRFLFYNAIWNDINFSKLTNLKVLMLPSTEIQSKKLLNLPNIEVLIFKNIMSCFLQTDMYEYIFMFNNLPTTLNTIVFDGFDDIGELELQYYDDFEINKFLKQKTTLAKLPYNCKTYYIDYNSKIYTITE